ncbi:hypothetical protein F5Y00DRAFT_270950 [Daldinia vernicosa]|uniref:uncharacterized protein n=1 Tax=Daldinia vernicosa TaxID=114800 RepID=UPI002007B556|nr:uncharacterized protein F5Y00DRAFT_270950 [Daldinia vernicosa]KAI0847819.1 hypothetical protein F5Y00DRAFT_270950 [Daldinia vernicosa]
MPPNSFCEWVAGQNAPHRSTSKKPRPVFALQLETDDEYESDILRLTYPRTGRTRRPHGKKVRFTDNAHKVEANEPPTQCSLDVDTDASSTAVELNSGDDEATTDEDLVLDCPCTNCVAARRRLKNTTQTKGKSKKQQNVSTADASNHAAAVHARHKAKKAKEAEALKSKGGSSKRRAKQKSKHANKKSDSEVDTTDTDTDTEVGTGEETGSENESESESESEKDPPKKRGNNRKGRQRKQNSQSKKTNQGKQNKKKNKNKQDSPKTKEGKSDSEDRNEKQDKQKDSRKQDTKENEGAYKQDGLDEDKILQEADAIKKKRAEANQYLPQSLPYAPQQANFLMPPHPRMLQVEHAVELPNDPRPNAFFDGVHGIMRVYHGPHYGNAYGQLYPNAPYVNQNPTVNVSLPVHNPWQAAGFQPFPGGQPPPQPPQPPAYPPPPQEPPQHPPAATRRAPADNSWFQGYGSVTIGKPPEEAQEAKGSNFTTDPSRKNNEAWSEQHSTPTRKPTKQTEANPRSDRGGKSNVIPSIEVTDPEKPQGSEGARNKSWGTQSAHGSQKASESKEEGNHDSKGTDKAEQSGGGGPLDDVIARAEELYKTNSERFSPAPQNDSNQTGNGVFGDSNGGGWGGDTSWGDGNNDATAGDNSWGEKDTQEATTGGTDPPKPAEDNSNVNSSEAAGGNASIDNVAAHGDPSDKKDGDNSSNNGRNNGGKRSKASPKRSTPPKGPPGCWVSNPPSENEDSKPPASLDNVGPPAGGNGNGKKGKGKGKQKENGKPENNQASESGGNGNGNGGWNTNTVWADPDVAQSSGGAFDDDDKNKDGKDQQGVEW